MKRIFLLLFIVLLVNKTNSQYNTKRIVIGYAELNVEIADNDSLRKKGLMFRRSLPMNSGMLFIFKQQRILRFWMKNTFIPLDIGFFDKNMVLRTIKTMKPHDEAIVSSIVPVMYAVETNKGWFNYNKIEVGDKFYYIH